MKTHAWTRHPAAARRLTRPLCPGCDDMLVAPALSVHVHQDDIRHWWSCDACGYEFLTLVTVANMRAEQYRARMA